MAKIVGIKAHVIAYAISAGHLAEPMLRIFGKRVFAANEFEAVKKHFENRAKREKREATNAPE